MSKLFGKQLKKIRQAAGLTQRQLGERAGISLYVIKKIEDGQRTPGHSYLTRLRKALQVNLFEMFAED